MLLASVFFLFVWVKTNVISFILFTNPLMQNGSPNIIIHHWQWRYAKYQNIECIVDVIHSELFAVCYVHIAFTQKITIRKSLECAFFVSIDKRLYNSANVFQKINISYSINSNKSTSKWFTNSEIHSKIKMNMKRKFHSKTEIWPQMRKRTENMHPQWTIPYKLPKTTRIFVKFFFVSSCRFWICAEMLQLATSSFGEQVTKFIHTNCICCLLK